jgi:F-type H+-transporting ATPase subunit b
MLISFSLTMVTLLLEGINLIEVNPGLIIWVVVTFIVLMFVLKKVAWKPILNALDQRETAIRESLEKAEKAREDAQKILDENKANIAKADEESRKIIEQSRSYAEKLKDQILQESKQQAKKLIDDAAAEIERKKDAAFDELKSHVAEIAVDAAEKLLREKLNKEENKKLVDKYLGELTKN